MKDGSGATSTATVTVTSSAPMTRRRRSPTRRRAGGRAGGDDRRAGQRYRSGCADSKTVLAVDTDGHAGEGDGRRQRRRCQLRPERGVPVAGRRADGDRHLHLHDAGRRGRHLDGDGDGDDRRRQRCADGERRPGDRAAEEARRSPSTCWPTTPIRMRATARPCWRSTPRHAGESDDRRQRHRRQLHPTGRSNRWRRRDGDRHVHLHDGRRLGRHAPPRR